jgi:hypothetical protein
VIKGVYDIINIKIHTTKGDEAFLVSDKGIFYCFTPKGKDEVSKGSLKGHLK